MEIYDTRYMTQDEIEKMQLVNELKKIYPYPEKWFYQRTLAQLIAMYHKPIPKKKKAKVPQKEEYKNPPTFRINEETGDREILTDGGHWEPFDL